MEKLLNNLPFNFDEITHEEHDDIIRAINNAFPIVKVRDLVYDHLVPEFSFYAFKDTSDRLVVQVYALRLELDERWVMRKIKREFKRRPLIKNARLVVTCNGKQIEYLK